MAGEPKCFVLYVDGAGQWRWKLYAPNAKIIADSAESYKNRADAIHGARLVMAMAADSPIWDGSSKTWVNV
jgi:uncharacterized protein YegP (UPF0339 family)